MKEQGLKRKPKNSLNSTHSECPYDQCDGRGLMFTEREDGRAVAIECDCRKEKIISKKLEFANIPDKFSGMSIDNFKTNDKSIYKKQQSIENAMIGKRAAAKFINKFKRMKQEKKGLYFYSREVGSGKSMLASIIGNELIHKHKAQVKFSTTGDTLNAIRATYDPVSDVQTHELIEAIREVEVLILDDIGQDRLKKDTNDKLYEILNYRSVRKVITIFTSNCRIEELQYDKRIKDRIKKMAIPIHMPEESARSNISERDNDRLLEELLTS